MTLTARRTWTKRACRRCAALLMRSSRIWRPRLSNRYKLSFTMDLAACLYPPARCRAASAHAVRCYSACLYPPVRCCAAPAHAVRCYSACPYTANGRGTATAHYQIVIQPDSALRSE